MKKQLIVKLHILSTLCILVGCDVKNTGMEISNIGGPTIIKIDPVNSKTVKFSEVFQKVDYIKLQSSQDDILGEVHQVKKYKNDFIVVSDQNIICFDSLGNRKYKIDKQGKGPGEYQVIWGVIIDSVSNTLEVKDRFKIIGYDINDGSFQYEWDHDIVGIDFIKLKEGIYFFYSGNSISYQSGYKLNLIDKTNNILKAYLPVNKGQVKYLHMLDARNFFGYADNINFAYSFGDTIYRISPTSISSRFVLDFGEYAFKRSILNKDYRDVMEFLTECRKYRHAIIYDGFLETKNHLFFTYEFENKKHHYLFDKEGNHSKDIKSWENDLGGFDIVRSNSFHTMPKGSGENELYFVYEPYDLIQKVDSIVSTNHGNNNWGLMVEKNYELYNMYKELAVNDNPIIFICALKEAF